MLRGLRRRIAAMIAPPEEVGPVVMFRSRRRVVRPVVEPKGGMQTADLITLCDAFAAHRGISHWRVSVLAGCGGGFFKGLKDGGGCTLRTAHRLLHWFSDHWPEGLAWPDGIQRPPKTEREAA